ncbi:sugar phosphate isomerase/epimerase family protein [Agrobacterium sp. NPDC089420]|uniref:sugar phosphate isomerase/epimerase family protein n=1 Tax=Agrobacterium sp. NPDC089420 TaxID=3363918 RepID=UPI00384BAEA0
MTDRIISASGAPYDGYGREQMLESIARIGFSHVEPAFIVGYTEPFDESAFLPAEIVSWRRALSDAGLGCQAMSSHIDLGLSDSVEVFTGRMAFAAGIGARIIATNASARQREDRFLRNVDVLLRRAEAFGVMIALENPGDGSDNLFNTAEEGIALTQRFGSPWLGLNYDAANTASHRPQFGDFADDAAAALPACIHAHIKDVKRTPEGWFFVPVGEGDIDCRKLLGEIARKPEMPVSIEFPARLHRRADAQPVRRISPASLREIEGALAASLAVVRRGLIAG